MTTTIAGAGTTEAVWQPWLAEQSFPPLDVAAFVGRRVVVVAAHPDDEVLGVGDLLASLAATGSPVVAVWATDGEASHPRSTRLAPGDLAELRRRESTAALTQLEVEPAVVRHLGLPDSGLVDHVDELAESLSQVVRPDDVVLAPWRADGHPDHEAAGRAAAAVAPQLVEYPIWMWHWATPRADEVPWDRARRWPLSDVARKRAAIDAFVTQVQPLGPSPDDATILPPHVVARFLRDAEVVFA